MNSQERSASLNVEGLRLVQVGQACQAFEAAWKSGARPQVEAFLGDTQGELRSALLQELLLLDIQYRQMAGELPAARTISIVSPRATES